MQLFFFKITKFLNLDYRYFCLDVGEEELEEAESKTIPYTTTWTEEPVYLNNTAHSYCQDCDYKGLTECKLCILGDRHSEMR